MTIEKLEAQEASERKKYLGYFIRKLRERVDLNPEFDEMLRKFLDYRNTFVHNVSEVSGWNLETEDGRLVAIAWLKEMHQLTEQVSKVFWGLAFEWEKSHGIPRSAEDGGDFFEDIDPTYTTLATMLFIPKQS